MKVFIMFWSILLVFVLSNSLGDNSDSEEIRIIPEELYKYGLTKNCHQISSFYKEHLYVRKPPYIYGILSKNEYTDRTAAFWCKKKNSGKRDYTLLLKLNGKKWSGGCGDEIRDHDMTGGLYMLWDVEEPLDWYWEVDNKTKKGKSGTKTSGPIIESIYDGTGFRFYCHQGKWMGRLVH